MAKRKYIHISKEAKTALCFLAPSLIGIAVMCLIPTVDVIRRAFFSAMGNSFVGLNNLIAVLTNASFSLAVRNTTRFLTVCIPLLLMLSLLTALLLVKQKWYQNFLKTTYLLPMVIPVTSVVLIIRVVFETNGLLNAVCAVFGITPIDWLNSDYAFLTLLLCYLWKNIGYNIVLWLAGLSAIPQSLYEAARLDGANEWQCFRSITLPLIRPTVFMTAVLALINSFKVFREAYLVAGRYPHRSIYMLQHVLSNWFTNLDMQKISAAAVLLMAAILIILLFVRWAARQRRAFL